VLGFQSKGKLTNRYCVLFENRLDMWDDPTAAASGCRPTDRIVLGAIRSLATVFGGFIITNRGGKRTGVHVDNKEELREWSAALASVISATGSGIGSGLAGGGGGPRGARLRQISQSEDEDEEAATLAKPTSRSPDWLPRVATLATKARPSAPKKTLFSDRALGGKHFACNTHPAAVMRELKKDYAAVLTASIHQSSEVTDKIGNSSGSSKQPRLPRGVLADASLAGKVTDRSRESLVKASDM